MTTTRPQSRTLGDLVDELALARPQAPLPAVLSVRSRRLAFRQRMLIPTPRASVVEARWCRREWPMRTGPASTQY